MSFEPDGYLLTARDGPQLWFIGTRMNVKAGGAQTGGAFTFIEWSAPAGFGPPLHVHGREDEAFHILDGQISVQCGSKRFTAGPGDFTFLPRGIPHTFLVTGARCAGYRSPRRPGSRSSSRRRAAPPSGPACPTRPNPTSRSWPPPGNATATRSSARHRPRHHGDPS